MAELVDALDSGSSRGNSVDVRVILAAIFRSVQLEIGHKPRFLKITHLLTPKVIPSYSCFQTYLDITYAHKAHGLE